MAKKYRRKYPSAKEPIWHYETDRCHALCREREPLFNTSIPDHYITPNPVHVTCLLCQKIMQQKGILPMAEMAVQA